MSQKQNILGANWIAPVDSTPRFCDSSGVPSFLVRKVEDKSFLCTHKLGERTGQVWQDNNRRVRTHEKNSGETVRRLGTIIQSIFLCQIRSRHPLEFLEIVQWESVPRGSFARTWKLSCCLFSWPDWLPLGLRGWVYTFQLTTFFQSGVYTVHYYC